LKKSARYWYGLDRNEIDLMVKIVALRKGERDRFAEINAAKVRSAELPKILEKLNEKRVGGPGEPNQEMSPLASLKQELAEMGI
jgi:hypothetical protein